MIAQALQKGGHLQIEFLASFILPNGILDWFDFVKAKEELVEKKPGNVARSFKMKTLNDNPYIIPKK